VRHDREGGQVHFAVEGGLCVEEPVWKLRVEYARVAGHAPADLWTVRDVPITRQGSVGEWVASTTRYGVKLALLGIAAPGVTVPFQGVRRGDGPAVYVSTSPPIKGVYLMLLRVIDDQGREIRRLGPGSFENWQYRFGLQARPAVRTVDLTFAVVKSRFTEFMAKPTCLRE
jgi:hypothetical protein